MDYAYAYEYHQERAQKGEFYNYSCDVVVSYHVFRSPWCY